MKVEVVYGAICSLFADNLYVMMMMKKPPYIEQEMGKIVCSYRKLQLSTERSFSSTALVTTKKSHLLCTDATSLKMVNIKPSNHSGPPYHTLITAT